MVWVLGSGFCGFRVQVLGVVFRVQGPGLLVKDFGLTVEGWAFRVWGFGI